MDARSLPHLVGPSPLHFPAEAEVPESFEHVLLRTLLFQMLMLHFEDRIAVGSEQFVYFDAADPSRCLAPDVFVKLGVKQDHFRTWKTWERAAPELCVEIVSESDTRAWDDKLRAYHAMGVRELVRFDADAPEGSRVRVWDRIDEVLVPREIESDRCQCLTLSLHWVVAPADRLRVALRFARDASGRELLPTPEEARTRAERRIAELEAELRRRS
jgi:Uma2 family endonuclease